MRVRRRQRGASVTPKKRSAVVGWAFSLPLMALGCGAAEGGKSTDSGGAGASSNAGSDGLPAGGRGQAESGRAGAAASSPTGGSGQAESGRAGAAGSGGASASGAGGAISDTAGAGGATANGGAPLGGTSGSSSGTAAGIAGDGTGGVGPGGASSGSGGTPSSAPFSLVFRDEFDALDSDRWQLMTHSWDTNLALFSASAVSVQDGFLRLTLTPAPSGTMDDQGVAKSFLGAEVRSKQTVNYGRVRARARFATGSAVVSALVTIYTPWPADNWNELDIECLGKDPSHVQFNAMVYTGVPVMPPVTQSVTPTQYPQKVELGFDPSADYHVYEIEWTPAGARFLVDDVLRHTWSTRAELMGLPQNTLLTIWASSSDEWAGPITAATGQATASYDWLELYRFEAN